MGSPEDCQVYSWAGRHALPFSAALSIARHPCSPKGDTIKLQSCSPNLRGPSCQERRNQELCTQFPARAVGAKGVFHLHARAELVSSGRVGKDKIQEGTELLGTWVVLSKSLHCLRIHSHASEMSTTELSAIRSLARATSDS